MPSPLEMRGDFLLCFFNKSIKNSLNMKIMEIEKPACKIRNSPNKKSANLIGKYILPNYKIYPFRNVIVYVNKHWIFFHFNCLSKTWRIYFNFANLYCILLLKFGKCLQQQVPRATFLHFHTYNSFRIWWILLRMPSRWGCLGFKSSSYQYLLKIELAGKNEVE